MTTEPSANIIYYGKKEELPPSIPLRAGKLSMIYQNGFLRYIKAGEHELLRMINHAIRDHNWGTIPLRTLSEDIQTQQDAFTIEYQAEARQGGIRFLWDCRIEGHPDSRVTFSIKGKALSDFRRNRIGFTVLHPIRACAGKAVTIIHPDGERETHRFPELINPHQPFFDIRGMEWKLDNGSKVHLQFSGDIFETEDQRNWMDDSYKTYCTPLNLPFPVSLKKGDEVKQLIELHLDEVSEISNQDSAGILTFSMASKAYSLPKIGIGQSSEAEQLSEPAISLLRAIPIDHYQADIKLFDPDWPLQWERLKREHVQLAVPLEISLFFDDVAQELPALLACLKKPGFPIAIINIFNKSPHVTQKETLERVLPKLRKRLPGVPVGAGTNAFFTELNRDRVTAENLDFVVYSINPQVHAVDNATLVENLNAVPYSIRTAGSFTAGKPIHISPVTLKMRWNPSARGEDSSESGQMPEAADVRQMSLFGAAWTLGCISKLLESGLESVTFYETVGLMGVVQSEAPRFPEQFRAPANTVYPMYFVFKSILERKGFDFFPLQPGDPLRFCGLAFREKGAASLQFILGNFTGDRLKIELPPQLENVSGLLLDADNTPELMRRPERFEAVEQEKFQRTVKLPPFGIGWFTAKG